MSRFLRSPESATRTMMKQLLAVTPALLFIAIPWGTVMDHSLSLGVVKVTKGQNGAVGFCVYCPSPPGGCFTVTKCLYVTASGSPASGNAPLSVSFKASANYGTTPYKGWSWTFGDGTSSTSQNPSHTYTNAGSYTATATVTDKNGYTASKGVAITVSCPDTYVAGQVVFATPVSPAPYNVGIYGAVVSLTQGSSSWGLESTDAYGDFSYDVGNYGCTGSFPTQFALSAAAPEFESASVPPFTVYYGKTNTENMPLSLWATTSAGTAILDLWSYTSKYTVLGTSVYSSLHVSSPSLSSQPDDLLSNGVVKAPPSGDDHVLELTGTDTSTTLSAGASLYYTITPLVYDQYPGFPLSGPMFLTFNVYVPSGGTTPHFAVDAQLSSGRLLSAISDSLGGLPRDQQGGVCQAAYESFPTDSWVPVTCDITEFRNVQISSLLLDYYDSGTNPGTLKAYFDGIQLQMPTWPESIPNGGFELGNLDGWFLSGTPTPSAASSVTSNTGTTISIQDGSYAAVLGHMGGLGTSYSDSSDMSVPIRLQNVDVLKASGTTMTLSLSLDYLWYYSGTLGQSGQTGSVSIWLDDRTMATKFNLPVSSLAANPSAWATYSTDLTAYSGHDLWIHFTVAENGKAMWLALDDVHVAVSTMTNPVETSSGGATASFTLPQTNFRPVDSSGSCLSQDAYLPDSFSATTSHSKSVNGGASSATSLVLAVDLSDFYNKCGTGAVLYFGATAYAQMTTASGGTTINDICITTAISPNSNTATQYTDPTGSSWDWNLPGSGWIPNQESEGFAGMGVGLDVTGIGVELVIDGAVTLPLVLEVAAVAAALFALGLTETPSQCPNTTGSQVDWSRTQPFTWPAPAPITSAGGHELFDAGLGATSATQGTTYTIVVTASVHVDVDLPYCAFWSNTNPPTCSSYITQPTAWDSISVSETLSVTV